PVYKTGALPLSYGSVPGAVLEKVSIGERHKRCKRFSLTLGTTRRSRLFGSPQPVTAALLRLPLGQTPARPCRFDARSPPRPLPPGPHEQIPRRPRTKYFMERRSPKGRESPGQEKGGMPVALIDRVQCVRLEPAADDRCPLGSSEAPHDWFH